MTDRSATSRQSIAAVARVAATRRDSMGTTRRPSSDTTRATARATWGCWDCTGTATVRDSPLCLSPPSRLGSFLDLASTYL
jgi:hypothetical protein